MKGSLVMGPDLTAHSDHLKPNVIYKNMLPLNFPRKPATNN
jgi:hypothetical protein